MDIEIKQYNSLRDLKEYKDALAKFYEKHSIIAVIFYALEGKISYIEV